MYLERDLYVREKDMYMYVVCGVSGGATTQHSVQQKRPVYTWKETCMYVKSDLYPKETFVHMQ